MTWVAVPVSVVAAVLVSPLLAGWTVGLTTDPATDSGTVVAAQVGERADVWSPSRPSPRSWPPCAMGGEPLVAWWLFACGGAVLCVVDAEHHLLPARLRVSARRRRSGRPCRYRGRGRGARPPSSSGPCRGRGRCAGGSPSRSSPRPRWGWVTSGSPPSPPGCSAGPAGPAVLAGQLAAFGLAVVTAGILAIDPTPGAWPGDAGPDGTGAHRRRDPGDLALEPANAWVTTAGDNGGDPRIGCHPSGG